MQHIGRGLQNVQRNIELVGADAVSQHGFTMVPNFVLTDENLTTNAKVTYAMLLKYAWQNDFCYPGQEKLAEDMGITDRSVRNHIKELEAAEYIEVVQRGLGKTNLYRLFLTVKGGKKRG